MSDDASEHVHDDECVMTAKEFADLANKVVSVLYEAGLQNNVQTQAAIMGCAVGHLKDMGMSKTDVVTMAGALYELAGMGQPMKDMPRYRQ